MPTLSALSLKYTLDPIPHPQHSQYNLRNESSVGQIVVRTDRFQTSFYPNCISEWNKLESEVRLASSAANLKSKLLLRVRLTTKAVFGIYNSIGLSYLT